MALAASGIAGWALRRLSSEPVATPVAPTAPLPPAAPAPERLDLTRADFSLLPDWELDRIEEAAPALRTSCARGVPSGATASGGRFGSSAAWRPFCSALTAIAAGDGAALRALVERELVVWAASNRGERSGLLTGYYEPELAGSRTRSARFRHPLYRDPNDRQVVDLGEFKQELAGKKISGQVQGGRFRPYWDRAEIERGSLAGRRLELLWVEDPVALFFLQIQGSGRVVLPDGSFVRVGYAGQNGHDYTAIGRVLIERGELTKQEVSLQSIRAWLRAHPAEADAVMHRNRSFVFFRLLEGEAPEGGSGVELTAGRSLAVDDELIAYGLPLFLDSTLPAIPELGRGEAPLRRLVVSQDTGGAIRGAVRGDLFLGPGQEAEETAGRMKQPLRIWILLPPGVDPRPPA